MKFAVIDVGSNSVRLMLSDGVNTFYKKVITTQLAKGMIDNMLSLEAVERTCRAVSFFVNVARQENVDKILCYATAAVRSAKNKEIFVSKVKELCDLDVDVIDGNMECLCGVLGALNGSDGAILDIGGASTEIAVLKHGQLVYSHSLDIGAVKLTDLCGQDKFKARDVLQNLLVQYGEVDIDELKGIGGTATSITAMLQELEQYDVSKTHDSIIRLNDLHALVDKLYDMSVEERKKMKGLQPERAEVIASGALIMLEVMKYLSITQVIVSEMDNLEGYLYNFLEKK